MRVTQVFIDAPIVGNDHALTADVIMHLSDHVPNVITAYPPGYFVALVRHSAIFARDHLGLNEIAAIRLFVRLRWEIAPGFYREPTIAAALANRSVRPIKRFEALLTPDTDHVWLDAMAYDGPAYWRGQHSEGFGDTHHPEEMK